MIRKLIVLVFLVCVTKIANAYKCYDCNSTIDGNCFDLASDRSYFKADLCADGRKGKENCVAIELIENSARRMYRFCGKVGTCDSYQNMENEKNLKVVNCMECDREFCNEGTTIHHFPFVLFVGFVILCLK